MAAKQLLDDGVSVDAKNKQGCTALGVAVEYERIEIIALLLERGADIHTLQGEEFRATVIHNAVSSRSKKMVQLLLDLGASVDSTDEMGWTLLHLAASIGDKDMMAYLLDHGADMNAQQHQGCTACISPPATGTVR